MSSLLFVIETAHTNILSTDGDIKFKLGQTNEQMRLNSTGLGIHTTTPAANLHIAGNAIVSGQLHIGGTNGSANLNINGSLGYSILTLSSNTTLDESSYVFANTSSGNVTLTLPYAGNVTGRFYHIKKTSQLNYLYLVAGGNYIDRDTHLILEPNLTTMPSCSVFSDGSQWYLMQASANFIGIAADNLIGYWGLDESSAQNNVAYDWSVYQNHGTLNNIAAANIGVSGKVGQAIDFDGNGDRVELGDLTILEGDNMKYFTIALWVYMMNDTGDNDILVKGIHTNNQPFLLWRDESTTDKIAFLITDSDGDYFAPKYSNTAATLNTWMHIAITFSSNLEARLYINGVEESNSPFAATTYKDINSNTGTWKVGSDNNGGTASDFRGKIDDLRFYNRVLTANEINQLYFFSNH